VQTGPNLASARHPSQTRRCAILTGLPTRRSFPAFDASIARQSLKSRPPEALGSDP
jgi:hypothetical protein